MESVAITTLVKERDVHGNRPIPKDVQERNTRLLPKVRAVRELMRRNEEHFQRVATSVRRYPQSSVESFFKDRNDLNDRHCLSDDWERELLKFETVLVQRPHVIMEHEPLVPGRVRYCPYEEFAVLDSELRYLLEIELLLLGFTEMFQIVEFVGSANGTLFYRFR